MLTIVITGLVLMRARGLSEALSSSSDVWKEWELRGAVFLSLALQIVLICLGSCRKYFPSAWIRVITWLAYLLADSVAIYALGMISSMIREIKAGKSLSKIDPFTELSAFWAPFLLLHLGGPDTISAYSIEDNELWLRHSLTLVNQAGLTVYVLGMAWTNPTLSFLAILILLSGFYKYGERVWVLRAASKEYLKDFMAESRRGWKDPNKIMKEWELKRDEGYDVVPHQVINVENDDAIMIDVAIAAFSSEKCVAGTLLSASRLVDNSQRLFADDLFSMEERDSCLSILSGKHCAGDFKVIEIELGLIYDMFYSKAKAVYTRWGFICRLAILFSICVALVLFSFTDKGPYSKPDLFLTFLLLGAAIFIELYALAHILFSDQAACWLIKNKQSAAFSFINRIRPLLKRSNSMGQYSLMYLKKNDSFWWRFLKLLHLNEMAVKFLYQGHKDMTDDIRDLILSKIKEMAVKFLYQRHTDMTDDIRGLILSKIKEMEANHAQERPSLWIDRGGHALSTHKLLGQLKWSIELDFDTSILVWHIATELLYYLDDGLDSIEEHERNNQSRVKEKSLMSLHLSQYMLYLLFMCPSMLPARIGGIRFRDIYKEPIKFFDLPKFGQGRPARDALLHKMRTNFNPRVSKEDQVDYVLSNACRLALELERVPREWKWSVISEVWAEMLMHAANKCQARDHAQQMQRGSELITHVWLLMAHHGLTEHFQKRRAPAAVAEIIVNSW